MSLSIFGLVFANGPLSHVEYSTYIGGSGNEYNSWFWKWWMAKDSKWNIYIIWTIYTATVTNYPTTPWVYQPWVSWAWTYECVISKFDSTLSSLLASTHFWWEIWQVRCSDIEIDSQDNVFIATHTTDSNLPVHASSYDPIRNGWDAYIAKMDSDLTTVQQWTYFWGTSNEIWNLDLEIAWDWSIYFTSSTYSSNLPIAWTPYQGTKSGYYDYYIAHMDNNLSTLNDSTYIWGPSNEIYLAKIDIDSNWDVYLLWSSRGDGYPTTSWSYQSNFNGWNLDFVISRFDSSLTNLLWSTYLWSTWDEAYSSYLSSDITVGKNSVYINWITKWNDFPTTSWVYDQVFWGVREWFVAKFDKSFSVLEASTFVWWSSEEMMSWLELDVNGNVIFHASTASVIPLPSDAAKSNNQGWDWLIWILTPDLTTLIDATYLWGSWSDYNYESDETIMIDEECIYITSNTASQSSFPLSTWSWDNPYIPPNSWSRDYTITKMCPASCGDNVVQDFMWEECDDENKINWDGCSATCKIEKCGDGVIQWIEECDDGNISDADGCSSICELEPWYICYDTNGSDGSTQEKAAFGCRDLHLSYPSLWDGLYWIDPYTPGDTSDALQAYCDMTTDGGWWTLALNYLHQWWTNPATEIRSIDLPVLWGAILWSDESGTSAWWHASNILSTAMNPIQMRWYGQTEAHDRIIHFTTEHQPCIDYITSWIWSCNLIEEYNYTLLQDHTAINVPQQSSNEFSSKWDDAMTDFPIRLSGTSHRWIRWLGSRWEVDDFAANSVFDTHHQIRFRQQGSSVCELACGNWDINTELWEECDDWNLLSKDGCSGQDAGDYMCHTEYCRDDAPLNDTSKNFVITALDPTSIAGTSSQPNSELTICIEDTTGTRDIFYITTDMAWSFVHTPNLAPYAAPWINVWVMLHNDDGLDIDHHALMMQK